MLKQHLIIFVAILTVVPTIVQHQSFAQQTGEPKSTVVNSKYLTIKDLVYTNEDPTSTINGTVVNNSPVQISSAEVFAMLYDKNNSLITAESGFANSTVLNPGQSSRFTVYLFGFGSGAVDHYTVIPAGTS